MRQTPPTIHPAAVAFGVASLIFGLLSVVAVLTTLPLFGGPLPFLRFVNEVPFLFVPLAIAALTLGIVSLAYRGSRRSRSMAIAGLSLGLLTLVYPLVLVVLVIYALFTHGYH